MEKEAYSLLSRAKLENCEIPINIYTKIINMLCELSKLDKAEGLLIKLQYSDNLVSADPFKPCIYLF